MADIELIVKMDENVYTRLFDNGIQDNEIATDDICEMVRVLRLGKLSTPIPDNATNGDVIKALFPNEYDFETDFDEDWWNSPYQKGNKK